MAIGGLGEAHGTVREAYKGQGCEELSKEEWTYDTAGEASHCPGWHFGYWFGSHQPVGQ
jgi:hypothetical protein